MNKEEELEEYFFKCGKIRDPYECLCTEAVVGETLWGSSTGEEECEYYCSSCAYEKLHQYDGVADEFENKIQAEKRDLPPEFYPSNEDFWKLI